MLCTTRAMSVRKLVRREKNGARKKKHFHQIFVAPDFRDESKLVSISVISRDKEKKGLAEPRKIEMNVKLVLQLGYHTRIRMDVGILWMCRVGM